MGDMETEIAQAVGVGKLLETSAQNLRATLAAATSPVAQESVAELIAAGEWDELNDRFYRTLAFGTGGIRGRTIGKLVTQA